MYKNYLKIISRCKLNFILVSFNYLQLLTYDRSIIIVNAFLIIIYKHILKIFV